MLLAVDHHNAGICEAYMNVREVVQAGMAYVKDVFESEGISNLGLEEVTFDSAASEWIVTVGFSRPWDYPKNSALSAITNASMQPSRSYKVLRVRDSDGEVLSVKNRA